MFLFFFEILQTIAWVQRKNIHPGKPENPPNSWSSSVCRCFFNVFSSCLAIGFQQSLTCWQHQNQNHDKLPKHSQTKQKKYVPHVEPKDPPHPQHGTRHHTSSILQLFSRHPDHPRCELVVLAFGCVRHPRLVAVKHWQLPAQHPHHLNSPWTMCLNHLSVKACYIYTGLRTQIKFTKFANPTEMIVRVDLAGTLFRYLTLLRGFHKEAKQQKGSTTRRQPHDFLSAKVFLFKLNCVCYQKL